MSKQPPMPLDERERLAALKNLCLLDTPPDPEFDLITQMAARAFCAPIAIVSLVDAGRQWFKSRVGLEARETVREIAFCAYAIHGRTPLIVLDAREDDRFRDNPLVTAPPHVRFYAGAPLLTKDGFAIGTLCILGTEPRAAFGDAERGLLEGLASLVLERIETLRTIGYVDRLTLLPNRSRFLADVVLWRADPAFAADDKVTVAIDPCGVDDYYEMVRALGCRCAEAYLLAVKERLSQVVQATPLYRVGETLFAFVQNRADVDLPTFFARVDAALAAPIVHEGVPYVASLSMGAVALGECADEEDLLRSLITATDMARQQGRSYCTYERGHDRAQRRAFAILRALPQALSTPGQLSLRYQPRVDLGSGECVGVEALLRWRHPSFGEISPADFIPLAERTALMSHITRWVMRAAFAQAAAWQRSGHRFAVAINVSALDLDRPEFVDQLCDEVALQALDPTRLEIEFTESALSQKPDRLHEQLERIRAIGVQIAIDDFGTGYSNFAYLKRIPATTLKIDQSFIRSLLVDERDRTIVPSMIALGHELGHRIVAEGIETRAVHDRVRELGCDEGQGFWIARPMRADAIDRWLVEREHGRRRRSAALDIDCVVVT